MGWSDCGADSAGRPTGYSHKAVCDYPGCDAKIHRGLAYACGGMHGENGCDCEGYFCYEHQVVREFDDEFVYLCPECAKILDGGDFSMDTSPGGS